MQLNQLTFEKVSLLQIVGLLTGTAVAAAVWECVCVSCPATSFTVSGFHLPHSTCEGRDYSVSIQQRWMQPGVNTWLESSCSLPFSKILDAGNTHPSPHQMQIHDLQDRWKGVTAHRIINGNEPVFYWVWFVMCVCVCIDT